MNVLGEVDRKLWTAVGPAPYSWTVPHNEDGNGMLPFCRLSAEFGDFTLIHWITSVTIGVTFPAFAVWRLLQVCKWRSCIGGAGRNVVNVVQEYSMIVLEKKPLGQYVGWLVATWHDVNVHGRMVRLGSNGIQHPRKPWGPFLQLSPILREWGNKLSVCRAPHSQVAEIPWQLLNAEGIQLGPWSCTATSKLRQANTDKVDWSHVLVAPCQVVVERRPKESFLGIFVALPFFSANVLLHAMVSSWILDSWYLGSFMSFPRVGGPWNELQNSQPLGVNCEMTCLL